MKKRKQADSMPIFNRKGSSTIEYIIILVGILAVALIMYTFMANDGQSLLKDKIMAIIDGDVISNGQTVKVGESSGGSSVNNKASSKPPKRKQAKTVSDVRTTDEQLKDLAALAYNEPASITAEDADKILGKGNSEIIDSEDLPNGFQAVAIKNNETGEIIISFRGSDTEDYGIDWYGQNLSIYMQTKGIQVDSAKAFVERVKNSKKARDSSIVLTGHSLGGFHAQNMARQYDLPAVTFNAPGLKPHPLNHAGSPKMLWDMGRSIINPNMHIGDDMGNMFGSHDDQVVNYVNKRDAVGNYGIHYGKVVVVDPGGKKPKERNDYLHPIKDHELMVAGKAVEGQLRGGFKHNHSLKSFKGQFKGNGNIAR